MSNFELGHVDETGYGRKYTAAREPNIPTYQEISDQEYAERLAEAERQEEWARREAACQKISEAQQSHREFLGFSNVVEVA